MSQALLETTEQPLEKPLRRWQWSPGRAAAALRRVAWRSLGELAVIVAWAMWVGRAFLNLDPKVWPAGGEYGWGVLPQFVWELLPRCADCVLWNGSVNGGSPAFAELHGIVLHPFVVLTTVLWGAINSSKLTVVFSLVLAGLAQWWLARLLKLGTAARLWSALLAVVGGHLAGRMQAGLVALPLSVASASLVIPAGLNLVLTGSRRAAAGLGVALALLLVSGQMYLQVGTALAILPVFLLFLLGRGPERSHLRRLFALALLLTALLCGLFWVPMLHFWPNFAKHLMPGFEGTQSSGDAVLNLVISDPKFYLSDLLHKFAYPFIYVNYIGWVPVLLALAGLRWIPPSRSRLLAFFALSVGLVYLASSAVPLKLLAKVAPGVATAIRHPDLIASLAVPLVLGLAAWGLDELLHLRWPQLHLAASTASGGARGIRLSLAVLLLAVPLVWSLRSAYVFGKNWMGVRSRQPVEYQVIEELVTDNSEWVAPPFGQDSWVPLALERGLKITNINRPWFWKDLRLPLPHLEATRDRFEPDNPAYVKTIEDIHFYRYEDLHYACVDTGSGCVPCQAAARGGHIDVVCKTDVAGTLVVQENLYPGWSASRDGQALSLGAGPWLTVDAPAGEHSYRFRYRPWDVPLGALLTLAGLALAVWLWVRRPGWFGVSKPKRS